LIGLLPRQAAVEIADRALLRLGEIGRIKLRTELARSQSGLSVSHALGNALPRAAKSSRFGRKVRTLIVRDLPLLIDQRHRLVDHVLRIGIHIRREIGA